IKLARSLRRIARRRAARSLIIASLVDIAGVPLQETRDQRFLAVGYVVSGVAALAPLVIVQGVEPEQQLYGLQITASAESEQPIIQSFALGHCDPLPLDGYGDCLRQIQPILHDGLGLRLFATWVATLALFELSVGRWTLVADSC